MKHIYLMTLSLLVGVVYSAPTENSQKKTDISQVLPEKYIVYRSEYDIANILLPINNLNSEESKKNSDKGLSGTPIIFFALADFSKGQKEDKGFYIRKNGEVTKLLDHGREAATSTDSKSEVYIAAKDGIYTYNPETNAAEKYGIVSDDLIGIAKVNGSDIIYVLSKDHVVYKVTEKGTKVDKVVEIINPEQIVLDYENNLYYVSNNEVKIFNANGTRKVEGLPEKMDYVKLIRSPLVLTDGVPVIVDNSAFCVFANGTSTQTKFEVTMRPTAYSLEGTVLLYLGYDKKIYEYNIIAMIVDSMFSKFRDVLEGVLNKLSDTVKNF